MTAKYPIFTLFLLMTAALVYTPVEAQPMPASGFRAEFLKQLDEVEEKFLGLAESVPAEKYTWRPGEGVRSISEVYMHVAGSNYLLLQFIGVQPPPGLSREMEKITDKAKVLEAMKQSMQYVRETVLKIPDEDLERKVSFFNRDTTVRDVLFTAANHLHEHLGQSIAYARMNGVVPPWSAAQ